MFINIEGSLNINLILKNNDFVYVIALKNMLLELYFLKTN